MAVNRVLLVSVTLVFTFSGCLCAATTNAVDINTAAKQLVQDIHTAVTAAKYGKYIKTLHHEVLDIEAKAAHIYEKLASEVAVSECETNLVIKMAAAGTGSHEVMTVLLAKDPLSVLNGRLSLSLAVLSRLADQLEDELTKGSSDIGAQLSAIAFGASTTADIIDTAGKKVKTMVPTTTDNNNNNNNDDDVDNVHNRVRRQFNPNVNLGHGWSVGLGGVKWQSQSGSTTFTARPTFNGLKPDGFKVGVNIKF